MNVKLRFKLSLLLEKETKNAFTLQLFFYLIGLYIIGQIYLVGVIFQENDGIGILPLISPHPPPQKHWFGQLSAHENTFTRAKDPRWKIVVSVWSTEIRKGMLMRGEKICSHYPHFSPLPTPGSPVRRETPFPWEKHRQWRECLVLWRTPDPAGPRTRPTPAALHDPLWAPTAQTPAQPGVSWLHQHQWCRLGGPRATRCPNPDPCSLLVLLQ